MLSQFFHRHGLVYVCVRILMLFSKESLFLSPEASGGFWFNVRVDSGGDLVRADDKGFVSRATRNIPMFSVYVYLFVFGGALYQL